MKIEDISKLVDTAAKEYIKGDMKAAGWEFEPKLEAPTVMISVDGGVELSNKAAATQATEDSKFIKGIEKTFTSEDGGTVIVWAKLDIEEAADLEPGEDLVAFMFVFAEDVAEDVIKEEVTEDTPPPSAEPETKSRAAGDDGTGEGEGAPNIFASGIEWEEGKDGPAETALSLDMSMLDLDGLSDEDQDTLVTQAIGELLKRDFGSVPLAFDWSSIEESDGEGTEEAAREAGTAGVGMDERIPAIVANFSAATEAIGKGGLGRKLEGEYNTQTVGELSGFAITLKTYADAAEQGIIALDKKTKDNITAQENDGVKPGSRTFTVMRAEWDAVVGQVKDAINEVRSVLAPWYAATGGRFDTIKTEILELIDTLYEVAPDELFGEDGGRVDGADEHAFLKFLDWVTDELVLDLANAREPKTLIEITDNLKSEFAKFQKQFPSVTASRMETKLKLVSADVGRLAELLAGAFGGELPEGIKIDWKKISELTKNDNINDVKVQDLDIDMPDYGLNELNSDGN